MERKQKFYMISSELRDPYPPVECTEVNRLKAEQRDDYMLIEVNPPLFHQIYKTSQDIKFLIIATRFKSESLFPLSENRVDVYICDYKGGIDLKMRDISGKNLIILDKGEVYKKYDEAERSYK